MQESGGSNPVVGIISLIIAIVLIAAMWRVFDKAGRPGWAAIIPIYNAWVWCEIGGKPGWWFILMFIPVVNIIISILVSLGIAENFGKSTGFGVGLALLGFVFYPMLAFSDDEYQGS